MQKPGKTLRRAFILFSAGLCAVFSILTGLYLILIQDYNVKSKWLVDSSAVYFVESRKLGFKGEEGERYLTQAHGRLLRAQRMSPYDADLWIRLAYVLEHYPGTPPEDVNKALEIAARLDPARYYMQIERNRDAMSSGQDQP